MSSMKDYSADEWKAISGAATAAALAISLSNSGHTAGAVDEAALISKAITRPFVNAPEIVQVVAGLSSRSKPELPALPTGDRECMRSELIATVRRAVSAIEMKSPAETEPFKVWLASVAAGVCHAMSPANGRTEVSPGQQDAIDRLAEVLAVVPSVRSRRKAGPSPSARSVAAPAGLESRGRAEPLSVRRMVSAAASSAARRAAG